MKSTPSSCSTCASTKWPIRALAITGIETASMIPSIMSGSDMRETPPWARMSAGTRSSAMTATAPASSAIRACSGVTTSMMTPPLSISARPRLTVPVPVAGVWAGAAAVLAAVLWLVGAGVLMAVPSSLARRGPTAFAASTLPAPL